MKFSRIVTLYNQWHYLRWLSDERLFPADTEFIFVDDCSSQPPPPEVLAQIAARGAVLHVQPANRGRCVARNTGASLARGEFLDFVDGDDLPLPLLAEPTWTAADVVCFPFQVHGTTTDMRAAFVRHPLLADAAAPEAFIDPRPAAVLWRRNAFLELGGFDPQWETFEDVDLLLRAWPRSRAHATRPKQSYNQQSRPVFTEIASSGIRVRFYSRLPETSPWRQPLLEDEIRALRLQTTWVLLRDRRDAYLLRSVFVLLWNLLKARLGLLRR